MQKFNEVQVFERDLNRKIRRRRDLKYKPIFFPWRINFVVIWSKFTTSTLHLIGLDILSRMSYHCPLMLRLTWGEEARPLVLFVVPHVSINIYVISGFLGMVISLTQNLFQITSLGECSCSGWSFLEWVIHVYIEYKKVWLTYRYICNFVWVLYPLWI